MAMHTSSPKDLVIHTSYTYWNISSRCVLLLKHAEFRNSEWWMCCVQMGWCSLNVCGGLKHDLCWKQHFLRRDWMGVLRCSIIYSVNMRYNIKGSAAESHLRGGAADRQSTNSRRKKVIIDDTEILYWAPQSQVVTLVVFKDVMTF